MTNEDLAKKIYSAAHGESNNIVNITNCMTRLRLTLQTKDDHLLDELKKIDGVLGIHDTEAELQIVLGVGKAAAVAKCVAAINESATAADKPQIGDGKSLHEKIRAKNQTPGKILLKRIASIFLPLIPGFIACGLLTGCLAIAAKISPDVAASPLWKMLAAAGNTVFFGMNLFVGINTAKEFGGTPVIGGILGAFVSHPALAGIDLYGTELVPGRGGVIAVAMIAFVAAQLEKKLHTLVPEMFDLFVTPFLTILFGVLAAAFVLQPVGGFISDCIGNATLTAINSGGAFTGFILGGLWLPIVMTGIHQSMTPIHVDLLARYGVTVLLPILAMAGAGQVGAALAVYMKTKNRFLKKTVLSALPVGLMGIGEPLIYGVTLPLGKPFIAACIGGAFGGATVAHFAVGARAMGISGLTLTPTVDNISGYLMGVATAYVSGFIAAWIMGFNDPAEE